MKTRFVGLKGILLGCVALLSACENQGELKGLLSLKTTDEIYLRDSETSESIKLENGMTALRLNEGELLIENQDRKVLIAFDASGPINLRQFEIPATAIHQRFGLKGSAKDSSVKRRADTSGYQKVCQTAQRCRKPNSLTGWADCEEYQNCTYQPVTYSGCFIDTSTVYTIEFIDESTPEKSTVALFSSLAKTKTTQVDCGPSF